MVDEYSLLTGDTTKASFTGKSLGNGGSLGREAATGRGGVIALAELLKKEGREKDSLTYALQGFGNVGLFFSQIASQEYPHWKMVAAADSGGAVYAQLGLDTAELVEYKTQGGRLNARSEQQISSEKLLALPVDVLVLAALGDAVVEHNMQTIQAPLIVELANGPINEEAAQYLENKSIRVVPDIIANAGGVIVSYLEWVQNKQGEIWTETQVNQELERYMIEAINALLAVQKEHRVTLKEAAFILALQRLKEKV
jgi:glutamate dehydrogenase/leucine dehydrogenase